MEARDPESSGIVARLGVWDGVSIIVGIVVGVTIFKAPPLIFSNVSGPVSEVVRGHLGRPMATFGDAWAHRWSPRDTKKRMRDRTRCPTRSTVQQRTFPGWLSVMKTY